jgi:hypothetical protein
MKIVLLVLCSVSLLHFSCTKPVVDEPAKIVATDTDNRKMPLTGKWLLLEGEMRFAAASGNSFLKYDHFGPGRTTSSLRYEGSRFNFEELVKDTTTWSFYKPLPGNSYSTFVLNNDTLHPYSLNGNSRGYSIFEYENATAATMQLGGSARQVEAFVADYANKIMEAHVQWVDCSINGQSWHYFSILKFKKIEEW